MYIRNIITTAILSCAMSAAVPGFIISLRPMGAIRTSLILHYNIMCVFVCLIYIYIYICIYLYTHMLFVQ